MRQPPAAGAAVAGAWLAALRAGAAFFGGGSVDAVWTVFAGFCGVGSVDAVWTGFAGFCGVGFALAVSSGAAAGGGAFCATREPKAALPAALPIFWARAAPCLRSSADMTVLS